MDKSQLQRVGQLKLTIRINLTGQIKLAVNTNGPNKAPVSIAQYSDETLALATVLASRLPKYYGSNLPRVSMSRFRPVKILEKRLGLSGDEYMCELEPS